MWSCCRRHSKYENLTLEDQEKSIYECLRKARAARATAAALEDHLKQKRAISDETAKLKEIESNKEAARFSVEAFDKLSDDLEQELKDEKKAEKKFDDADKTAKEEKKNLEAARVRLALILRYRRKEEEHKKRWDWRESKSPWVWLSAILWPFYLLPMLLFFLALALVFWFPWAFCRSIRPHDPTKVDKYGDLVHQDFDPNLSLEDRRKVGRDVCSRIGRGPESVESGSGFGLQLRTFFWRRTWEMYQLLRELWVMLDRQGLQILGVTSGAIVIVWQLEMMVHDYRNSAVSGLVLAILRPA